MNFNFKDSTLFGNDAAEDEDDELFMSYAIDNREEVNNFLDQNKPIAIVRAYKGEGKSSLLKLTKIRASQLSGKHIVINSSAPDLSPNLDSEDNDLWVREWQKKLLNLIANEIGSNINLAFRDDAISLVEEAQNNGFKQKSFVRSVIERLTLPIFKDINAKFNGVSESQNKAEMIKRYLEEQNQSFYNNYVSNDGKWNIWLIIDDVDQNFENKTKNKIKISSFFTAIRQISRQIPEIKIRTTIRPNIWITLKHEFESLSHLEQYIIDMNWSLDDFYKLFSRRIEGYLIRNNGASQLDKYKFLPEKDKRKSLTQLIFDHPMIWGHKEKSAIDILYTLSRHRPRWAIELAREASSSAIKNAREKISYDDITKELVKFGEKRIADTIAEFKSQCPQIEDLLIAFQKQPNKYATDKLFKTIDDRILQSVHPRITGIIGIAKARDVAHFLYQIGFISARKDIHDSEYEHISYAQNPSLLRAKTNLDQGYSWEIHPIFRNVLDLQDYLLK